MEARTAALRDNGFFFSQILGPESEDSLQLELRQSADPERQAQAVGGNEMITLDQVLAWLESQDSLEAKQVAEFVKFRDSEIQTLYEHWIGMLRLILALSH
jgi:hypothetical protein